MEKLGKKLKAHEEDLNVEFEEVGGHGHEETSIQDFFENNKNMILGGLAVVALLVAGSLFWSSMQDKKNLEASKADFSAVLAWEAGDYSSALNGDSLGNAGFLDIISSYGSTGEGNAAKYYAGVAYLNLGDIDNGISYLEDFSKDDNALSLAAYTALGFAYEEKSDFKAAASAFESASAIFGADKNTAPASLMHAARNYEDAGDKTKALSIYKRIKKDYSTSAEAQNIDKYIGRAM